MLTVGVDLGGTNIAVGVVDEAGRILHKDSAPTGAHREPEAVIADIAATIKKVVADANIDMGRIASVGVGSPGTIKADTGEVVYANNLRWHFVPLGGQLSRLLDKPVFVNNDANVAALGELMVGGAKGRKNAIMLTLGTGVGGGIIIDGKIFSGAYGAGGELGHMCVVVDGEMCTCGNAGCLESYASATALINRGKEDVVQNPDGMIARLAGGDPDKVNAKIVVDSAKAGDPSAVKLFERYVYILSMGMVSLINAFDPEVFVLGGGVAGAGKFLLDAVTEQVEKHVYSKSVTHATIELAVLGNDAGIIGAAMLGR